MPRIQKHWELGMKAEEKFVRDFCSKWEIEKSSAEEDIYSHIDFYIKGWKESKVSIDLKRNATKDKYLKAGFFVELINVKGDRGWIEGKADYIVVATRK